MKHEPRAIAVRIYGDDDGKWYCGCSHCSYGWDVANTWEPKGTTFNECVKLAYQHLKVCPQPIEWKPTKGMAHETWIVRFL